MANRSASLLARSASIWERIIFMGWTVLGAGVSTGASTGAGLATRVGSAGLVTLVPAVADAAVGFVENDNRLEPELLFNTVFILDTILLNPPFFSVGTAGPSFAEVLIANLRC